MPVPAPPLPAPPWESLRARLLERVVALAAAGHGAEAAALRAVMDAWWEEQRRWDRQVHDLLAINHEIANALVGVTGNAQLLLMGPTGQAAGARERLEVVMREARRIQEAVQCLRVVKGAFAADGDPLRLPGTDHRAG